MKTLTVEKFRGLQLQANSFQDREGFFEIATNVVISRDDIVSSRRGYRSEYYMPENMNAIVEYQDTNFVIGNNIYRLDTGATGTSYCYASDSNIITRKTAHGLEDGYYVTDFLTSTEAFISSFSYRYADFVGQVQITTQFTLNASATGTTVTVTKQNHGLVTGDTVEIVSSAIGATGQTVAVTGVTANTFAYTDATATGTGAVEVRYIDAFQTTATNAASASGVGTTSWNDYKFLDGDTFTVDSYVPVLKTGKSLYWGANEGLHKIETTVGPVRKAGVPPGLDTDATLSGTSGGVAPNSQAAYRIVFGRKDANNVTHLGAPSDAVVLINVTRESTSVSLATGTNVLTVTDSGNGLTNGDIIYLYDVDSNDNPPNGSSLAVTGVTGTQFEFDFDDVGVAPTTVTSISYSTRKTATVYASIPSEIDSTEYFYQIFRAESVDQTVIPDARYKLIEQLSLTTTDIARGFIQYVDALPFEIIQSNAELYTNPTQEGEEQANERPPLFQDMALFKGYTFYANCTLYRELYLSLIVTTALVNGDTVTIAGSTYIFRGNATNAAIGNDITTSSVSVTLGVVTVTQVAHGLVSNDRIYLISTSGISLAAGIYTITVTGADTFTFGTGATGTSGTATFEGRYDNSGRYLVTLTEPSSTAAETIAEAIDFTARSLVKAVNRNTGATVYASYISGIDESPGRMLFTAKAANAAQFSATASSSTVGGCFSPILPTTGTTVSDFQDVAANVLFCSKYLENEAVPIVNRFPLGSQDSEIIRVVALRDSLIAFKKDGIFRLNGDSLSNFTSTALDTTVIIKSERSVAVLNNSVYALTNQGVVQVTDTSVRIVSRQIETVLNAILGNSTLDAVTAGIAYESERLYLLTTLKPNSTDLITYVFNYLTESWTTFVDSALAFSGFISGNDKLFHILATDRFDILKERKNQSKIDYTGQENAAQLLIKRAANITVTALSNTVCIHVEEGHGIVTGDVLTLSEVDAIVAAAFPSGASSVNGLRVVTSTTDKIVCFDAAETSTGAAYGEGYWNKGISELVLSATTANGSKNVTITTLVDHGLSDGDAIAFSEADGTLAGAFTSGASAIEGYKPIIVQSNTTFVIKATEAANSNATGNITGKDKRGIDTVITIFFPAQPQIGDALVSDNKIYSITDVQTFDSNRYVITINTSANFTSKSLVYFHNAYINRIKFAPITMGTGILKQFSEFQIWFRNYTCCSRLSVNFSTDSRYSDKNVAWSDNVSDEVVTFGGWGSQPWGNFPWGGGSDVTLDFSTGPSVPMRTYIPQNSYLATFIQPEIVHRVAGEPLDLQSIAILGKPATHKVSK